jgi:hypothetical protein
MRNWSTSSARRPARVLVTLAASLALVGLLAGPATAGRYVDQAAAALRRDPVYVDKAARRAMPPASASAVRRRIRQASTPVYVAVLPAAALREAGNDPNRLAGAIAAALGRRGTVAVAAGNRTGAGGNALDPGVAAKAMRTASSAHRGRLQATMVEFVSLLEARSSAGGAATTRVWDRPLVRPVAFVLAGLILLGLVDVIFLNVLRRRRRGRGAGFADVQALSREDIVALGEDLRNLDVGLEAESDKPLAVRDYGRAYESFQQGVEAFERAATPEELAPVSTALEAGRFFMTVARARFEGHELPRRRPPCFFDTRHGPSVDDVGWIPKSGPPRPVPACEACMRAIASGIDPVARQVVADGRRIPFYQAPPHFESWFAGYFGDAAASLVDGFPLGRALDDGYAGGLNTFGGGYGYLPVSYADTGVLDAGGADIGQRRPGADTELLIRPAGHDLDTGEE